MSDKNGVSVYILDREFKMNCPRGKDQELRDAAHFLDTKMREVRSKGVVGIERIAVVAALDFAHALLNRPLTPEDSAATHRITALKQKIDSVLSDTKECHNELQEVELVTDVEMDEEEIEEFVFE